MTAAVAHGMRSQALTAARDLALVVAVALLTRVAYVALLGDVMGADEAVNALMALAIARGQEFPVLMWEAHYSGTLLEYVAAGVFRVVGPSTPAFRAVGVVFGVAIVALGSAAARALWGRGAGLIAGFWLALGPPLLARLTLQTPGGYPEALVFGALVLWLAVMIAHRADASLGHWAALGAAGGIGAWGLPLALTPLAGALVTLRRRLLDHGARPALIVSAAFVLGAAPFFLYNLTHPGASFVRFGSRVTGVSAADITGAASTIALIAEAGGRYLRGRVAFVAALPRQIMGALGAMPLMIVTAIVAAACVLILTRPRERGGTSASSALGWRLVGWSALALLLFVIALDLVEPRHLAPAQLLLALVLGGLWSRAVSPTRGLAVIALAGWMTLNLIATLDEAYRAAPSAAPLTAALEARRIEAVYTDYNVAYPVMWESRERILASPAAGPVNVDRRPALSRRVERAERPAYVFAAASEPGAVFAREATRLGIAWSHARVGDFDVFLPLRHVRPADLRLVRLFGVDSAATAR